MVWPPILMVWSVTDDSSLGAGGSGAGFEGFASFSDFSVLIGFLGCNLRGLSQSDENCKDNEGKGLAHHYIVLLSVPAKRQRTVYNEDIRNFLRIRNSNGGRAG